MLKLNGKASDRHFHIIAVVLNYTVRRLRHKSVIQFKLAAVGERFKTNCIIAAGRNTHKLPRPCKEYFIFANFSTVHNNHQAKYSIGRYKNKVFIFGFSIDKSISKV